MTFEPGDIGRALEPYMSSGPTESIIQVPDWAINGKPAEAFAHLPVESLADGLETDLKEIRCAALCIPPSAIATEPEWMKVARALAHEAGRYPHRAEPLWDILDEISRRAPGYDEEDNRTRWSRYISEARNSANPVTLATLFHLAERYGWHEWSPANALDQIEVRIDALPAQQHTGARFRDLNQHGNPRPSLANAVIGLRALGIDARYDLFHRRIEVVYKGQAQTIREGLLTDDTVSAARSLINNTYQIDCGDANTLAAIKEIAFENAYDPVLDLLREYEGKWDGVKSSRHVGDRLSGVR